MCCRGVFEASISLVWRDVVTQEIAEAALGTFWGTTAAHCRVKALALDLTSPRRPELPTFASFINLESLVVEIGQRLSEGSPSILRTVPRRLKKLSVLCGAGALPVEIPATELLFLIFDKKLAARSQASILERVEATADTIGISFLLPYVTSFPDLTRFPKFLSTVDTLVLLEATAAAVFLNALRAVGRTRLNVLSTLDVSPAQGSLNLAQYGIAFHGLRIPGGTVANLFPLPKCDKLKVDLEPLKSNFDEKLLESELKKAGCQIEVVFRQNAGWDSPEAKAERDV